MSDFKGTIKYLSGFRVAPYEIDPLGNVLFTDGTNTGLVPSQYQCEAYGYTYDSFNQVCRLNQQYSGQIEDKIYGSRNSVTGPGHIIEHK